MTGSPVQDQSDQNVVPPMSVEITCRWPSAPAIWVPPITPPVSTEPMVVMACAGASRGRDAVARSPA